MTRRLTASPMVLGGLPAFTLTDQRGQPFGSRELAGKIWVADFIFTSCQGVCPLLSRTHGRGRQAARAHLGPDFHLVSISVDPERDTPARLAEYGARYGANPIAWSFLTGPEQAIQATVVEGFKVGAGKERSPRRGGRRRRRLLGDLPRREPGARRPPAAHPRLLPGDGRGLDKLMEAVGRVGNGA